MSSPAARGESKRERAAVQRWKMG